MKQLKKMLVSLAIACFATISFAQNDSPSTAATIKVAMDTSAGKIVLVLDHERVPATTDNFLSYVRQNFYSNTIFHRVIDGFMIQGGGFTADMQQKSTAAPIPNEGAKCDKNLRGTIAMARTSDPHSATSQFFINVADNPFLDFKSETFDGWGYCAFGHVVEGMDVVDKIKSVQTTTRDGFQDVPVKDVVIYDVKIVS